MRSLGQTVADELSSRILKARTAFCEQTICGAAMKSDFTSSKCSPMPQSVMVYVTITRLGLSALRIPCDGFKASFVTGWNTDWAMTWCVVVSDVDSRPPIEIIVVFRLWWPGHALRMPAHHLPFDALFAPVEQGCIKLIGGQRVTWWRKHRFFFGWFFPHSYLGHKRHGWLLVRDAERYARVPVSVARMLSGLSAEIIPLQCSPKITENIPIVYGKNKKENNWFVKIYYFSL